MFQIAILVCQYLTLELPTRANQVRPRKLTGALVFYPLVILLMRSRLLQMAREVALTIIFHKKYIAIIAAHNRYQKYSLQPTIRGLKNHHRWHTRALPSKK